MGDPRGFVAEEGQLTSASVTLLADSELDALKLVIAQLGDYAGAHGLVFRPLKYTVARDMAHYQNQADGRSRYVVTVE